MLACSNLALKLVDGQGAEKDLTRAKKLFEQACTDEVPRACDELGIMFMTGDGAPKDPEQAVELFSKACALGSANACLNAGVCYRDGEGTDVDGEQAVQFFSKACEGRNEKGCSNLGIELASSDPSRARPLLTEGCKKKFAGACEALRTLGKKKAPTSRKKQ